MAGITAANGGDNVGVYVPVFATMGVADLTLTVISFLALVAVWCAAGWFLARRQPVARTLARWGHLLVPAVLIGIGVRPVGRHRRHRRSQSRRHATFAFMRWAVLWAFSFEGLQSRQPARRALGRRRLWCIGSPRGSGIAPLAPTRSSAGCR